MSGLAPLSCLHDACAGFARVGVAVSGGGDSVAALVLAVESLGAGRVAAVTVDHGLRPEAKAEAEGVARLCASLGVEHSILRCGPLPAGNVMAGARAARRELIAGWAAGRVEAVVLAHTRDDQAETLLMRLARGSGVDGLSGMAAESVALGVRWLRPFLQVPREALRGVLRERGLSWVEDPTNIDPAYQRSRIRAALAECGLDAGGLAATAARLGRAREALGWATQRALEAHVVEVRGVFRLAPEVFDLPADIGERLLGHLLRHLSGGDYPPRRAEVQRLLVQRRGTLAGCALGEARGQVWLWREAQAAGGWRGGLWDGRWRAEGPGAAGMAPLGEAGLQQLSRQAAAGLHPHWREAGLPRAALAGLPGLWLEGALVASPLTFWPQGWAISARPLAALHTGGALSH